MIENWWKKFFISPLIMSFLERDERTIRVTVKFLVSKLKLKKGMVVFDQCCGTGTLAKHLANFGVNIIGVDQSQTYINIAKKSNLSCRFYKGDVCNFTPRQKCDAAINWHTSFGYFRDDAKNIKILKQVYKSLKNGSYFALDYHNMPKVFANFEPVRRKTLIIKNKRYLITRLSDIDLENGMLISIWNYRWPNGQVKKFFSETRTYLPSDIKSMLLRVGFKDVRFYGNIDGRKLYLNSPRCIAIARK